MSITDRDWTTEELRRVGEDNRLATLLVNSRPLSEEAAYARSKLRYRKFSVYWDDGSVTSINALDEESLGWFLSQEYHSLERIEAVEEVITRYVQVPLDKLKLSI